MRFFKFMSETGTRLHLTNIKNDVYGEPRVTEIDDEKIPELYESDSDSDDEDEDDCEEEMEEDEEIARILKRREAIKKFQPESG